MGSSSRAERLTRLAPWLAGAVVALPVLVTHYPPMGDVPVHEAVVGFLRHWGDPRFVPPGLYELNLGRGNQLFYFLILALSYALPMAAATKLVVAAALVTLPVAAGRLADHLGVTRWTAALVAPIGLGWLFFWGLLANLVGLGLYLLALPALDRFCEKPTRARLGGACAIALVLHLAHDAILLVAAGTIVLFTLLSWRGWRENLVRLVPAGLALAIAVVTRALEAKLRGPLHETLPAFVWYGLGHKIATLPGVLYAANPAWIRDLLFAVCTVPMVLFAIEGRRKARSGGVAEPASWRARAHEHRFTLLGASLGVAYLAAPAYMRETAFVYHRFLAPAWILLTLSLAARGPLDRPWLLPRALAALAPFAPVFTSLSAFAASDRSYTELDALLPRMETGSTYLTLDLGPAEDPLFAPIGGAGHVDAVLGGRGLSDYTSAENAPVYMRNDRQWTTMIVRMTKHSYEMMPSYDLTRFRYVLFHTPDPRIAAVATMALAPEARPIAREGEWTLLESTLPQVPIDSPDEPTPTPAPKTLHDRCVEVDARLRAAKN